MVLLPEVYNSHNLLCLGFGITQVETIKESTIHTIRRMGKSPIVESIYKAQRNFQYAPTLLQTSIYHFPGISAIDCIYINLLK